MGGANIAQSERSALALSDAKKSPLLIHIQAVFFQQKRLNFEQNLDS